METWVCVFQFLSFASVEEDLTGRKAMLLFVSNRTSLRLPCLIDAMEKPAKEQIKLKGSKPLATSSVV